MANVIYSYNPVTREYLGAGLADESPLEPGVLLLPANSTRNAPPPAPVNTAPVFDPVADDWVLVPDFRGAALYSTADGLPVTVANIGPAPDGTTDRPRPSVDHRWVDGAWALDAQAAADRAVAQYSAAIQSRLDEFARTRNYDGILSACTYATSAVPQFAAEGQYAVAARDVTWAQGYAILQAVQAEERPAPTLDELFAELPALAWPE